MRHIFLLAVVGQQITLLTSSLHISYSVAVSTESFSKRCETRVGLALHSTVSQSAELHD